MAKNKVQHNQKVGLLSVGGAIFSGKATGRANKLMSIMTV